MDNASFLQDLFGMQGQVAVVVGGAGALGLCLATGLGKNGAKIVVADMNEDACKTAVEKLSAEGIEAIYKTVNVTDKQSLIALREEALKLTGQVDMLINCAGINAGTSFLEVDENKWDKDGGSILNIGSVNTARPLSRVFAYAASKAGVVNLTRNIAQEFGTQGIRCNAICPGFFPAEQNRKLLDAKRVENIMNGTPMRRYGDPNELVGAAILLLAKKAGSYITGSPVYVDGGFTASWF